MVTDVVSAGAHPRQIQNGDVLGAGNGGKHGEREQDEKNVGCSQRSHFDDEKESGGKNCADDG